MFFRTFAESNFPAPTDYFLKNIYRQLYLVKELTSCFSELGIMIFSTITLENRFRIQTHPY